MVHTKMLREQQVSLVNIAIYADESNSSTCVLNLDNR